MSPGVANITFEQVYDINDNNSRIFETSLKDTIDNIVHGKSATLVVTGAKSAGKSLACHGDRRKLNERKTNSGLITLAIQETFSILNEKANDLTRYNVLLSCWGADCNEMSNKRVLMDLLAFKKISDVDDIEKEMINGSILVNSSDEAVHLYMKALERVSDAEKQNFVFVLHVETQWPSGEVRRGRFIVIDIHGGSIIEPRAQETGKITQMKDRNRIFADTSLSVNKPLSAIFGAFIADKTCVAESQAIQSLLYACKAKEIKNTSPTNYLPFFVNRANTNQYFKTQTNLPQDTEVFASDVHDEITVLQLALENRHPKYFSQTCSPPLSTTSNDSSYESPFAGASTEVSLAHRVSVKGESEESQKQLAVSRRLRIAYDIAKAATDLQSKQSIAYSVQSVQTGDTSSHAAIDESLAHSPCDMIHKQSAQAKLETLKSTHTELERALAHEASIKNKCVDRISRLSQTLNCQMVEHEKQLQAALKAKSAVEDQLRDVNAKFDDAKLEVLRLQEEVKSLRAIQPTLAEHTAANERRMLHTLSARLEQAMIEAKDVITFKDGIITSLENRLELASKRGVDAVTLMQEERSQFEREKTKLFTQLENNKKIINSTENEEILRLKTENLSLQQQNGDLTAQVKHLALDLESARLQWTKEASHREVQAEQRCAQQLVQAEKQLEQVTIAMQQQMAQFRNELDMKVARQRVAAQVACKASSLKCDLVERKLERMKKKGVKQKVKMEEKSRTLLANASKEYDKLVASLQRELMELAERLKAAMTCEENALRRAKKSEEDAERLKVDLEQLQSYTSKLDKERVALSQACKELETDKIAMKAEFEIRTHEMEKLLAKQIMAAEARVHKERDNEIQILTERHNAEIESLQCESNNREKETMSIGLTRKQTPSAESSHTSSGQNDPIVLGENPQKSISDLGELIDSKERRCKNLTKQDRADEKAFIAMKRALLHKEDEIVGLTERQKQLLAALAMANEQETLAKKQSQELELLRQNEASRYEDLLQQLNSVKQENWNLSLALNITEATNQPKSHEI